MTSPESRPWDGRVRKVVEVLSRQLLSNGGQQYVAGAEELLDCGHIFRRTTELSSGNPTHQFRVCRECPQWVPPERKS